MKLTNDVFDEIYIPPVDVEALASTLPVWHSKPLLRKGDRVLPLEHEAASESFLVAELEGRARLSHETRLREERRLALRQKKRKRHGGASRGRRHWKSKEKTRQRMLDRKYDEDAYTWFMWANKRPVDMTREEWDRWLQPIFENYPRKSLRWTRPNGRKAYSVYNLKVWYQPYNSRGKKLPEQMVYNGEDSLVWDAQNPELAERVVKLQI